jgi:hypothetical protein
VGSTTLAPGESTNLDVSVTMGQGMGGMHVFEVTVNSNDPSSTNNKVTVRVDFME